MKAKYVTKAASDSDVGKNKVQKMFNFYIIVNYNCDTFFCSVKIIGNIVANCQVFRKTSYFAQPDWSIRTVLECLPKQLDQSEAGKGQV